MNIVTFTGWSWSNLHLMWERHDPWTRSKYFWPAAFGYKDKHKIYKVFNYTISTFSTAIGCIRATVIPGPLNKASFWCQLDPSQKCHRMTPSTAGWLKNMVSRFSRAAAFLCSSAASTVSSVAQIFKPASATLSSLYCDDTKVHNQSKMALNIKCQNRS